MTFFNIALFLSCCICLAGLAWRLWGWLRVCVRRPCPSWSQRLGGVVRGLWGLLRPEVLKQRFTALGRDVLLQWHVRRQSLARWLAHFGIFTGFLALVFMHAMDGVISYRWLPGYEPTLDPYQFLRDLFGVIVLAGVLMALFRRVFTRALRRVNKRVDWIALGLVAAIIGSGFLLEAVKMTSAEVFDSMVEQYYPDPPPEELEPLKQYWAARNGVVFPGLKPQPELVDSGADVNDMACSSCHSPTASAFVSFALAKGLAPAASGLDALGAPRIFWSLHVLLAFFLLAYLPFGKFLHVLTAPLNLVLRPVLRREVVREAPDKEAPEASTTGLQAVGRGLGLDACTHCGVCSLHCSVAPIFMVLGNADILPSEKLASLRRMTSDQLQGRELADFAVGSFICTECYRCTELCPSRIDLQDLWLASKRELMAREQAEPHGLMVRRTAAEWATVFRSMPAAGEERERPVNLTDRRESYWACVQCTTCTSVCPVVAAADDPVQELDLTPQQIMNLMRMGLKDLALGSRMVWSCVTCYKCQENCPQGIKVADVLYELRNIAAERLGVVHAPGKRAGLHGRGRS